MSRRWLAVLAIAVIGAALSPAGVVSAHAAFVTSDPADGGVLDAAPAVVHLRFSEEVLAAAGSVRLLTLGTGNEQALRFTLADGGSTVQATLPALGNGAYIIRYVVIDPADLHRTAGSVSFGVGVAPPASESAGQIRSSVASMLFGAIGSAALIGAFGAALLLWLVGRGGAMAGTMWVLSRRSVVCSAVAVAAWVTQLVVDAAVVDLRQVSWSSLLLSSDPGRRVVIGVQVVAGSWVVLRLRRLAPTDATRRLCHSILLCFAGGLVLAASLGGHGAVGGNAAVGVLVRATHLASLGGWLGVVGHSWWLTHRGPVDRQLVWRTASRSAGVSIAVVGASGLLMSAGVVSTITALLSTGYGRGVAAKLVLLAVLAALGAAGMRRVTARGTPVGRMVPVELAVAAVAVVVAAFLAGSAPAVGEQFEPAVADAPQVTTGDVADLTVNASIDPARPGANLVQVRVLDTRRPSPGVVESVSISVIGADGSVAAERVGVPVDGVVEWADVVLPAAGAYRVKVEVARPQAPVQPYQADWTVGPVPVPRATTVLSDRPWAGVAVVAAAVWLLVVWLGRRVVTAPRLVGRHLTLT